MKYKVIGLTLLTATMFSLSAFANMDSVDQFGCLRNLDQRVVSYNGKPYELSLASCELTDKDMQTVARYLASHPEIPGLDLDGNLISEKGLTTLTANHVQLKMLSYGYVYFYDATPVASAIAKMTSLKELDLSNDNMGPKAAAILATLPKLEKLFLSYNYIGDEGAIALSKNPSLSILDADGNNISAQGAKALAQMPNLEGIGISDNYIGDEGAKAFAASNVDFYMNLSANHITNKSMESFTDLKNDMYLGLEHNDITDEGAITLAKNLNGKGRKALSIAYNRIGSAGIAALKNVPNILWLKTTGNLPGDANVDAPQAKFVKFLSPSQNEKLKLLCKYKHNGICSEVN